MNNEVTGKLLEDFSQQLDRRQPTTAVKPARPSRMSMEGCGTAGVPAAGAETRDACCCASVASCRGHCHRQLLFTSRLGTPIVAAEQQPGVACLLKAAVVDRSNVLRDQSNLDLTAAAARTPKPPPGKGSSSPAAATDSAHKRPRTSGAFSARQNSGQVVAALNDHLALDGQVRRLRSSRS